MIQDYETSLWDLKLIETLSPRQWTYFIMRHPYGIWNVSSYGSVGSGIELWDIPMGFETQCLQGGFWWCFCIMRHPYGIWNRGRGTRRWAWRYYETSLWDLKHKKDNKWHWHTTLWDIPMGFETLRSTARYQKGSYYETSLWDLKLDIFNIVSKLAFIMRHPYGIWNHTKVLVEQNRELIMRHPYGIWNFFSKWVLLNPIDYETSLWDLKLLGSTLTGTRPKNYETSLWDLKLPRGEPNFILLRLWDIPMGFETTLRYQGWIPRCIMRHSYGIWNLDPGHWVSSLPRLWDIPMGFETSTNTLHRCTVFYYETSLWDLKRLLLKYFLRASSLWDIPMGFKRKWKGSVFASN